MNLIGKIFTVLIFIMSLVFMSFAVAVYATHTNHKAKARELTEELTRQKGINEQLENDKRQLQNDIAKERAARVNALAALEGKLLLAQQALTQKEDELAKLQAAHQVLVETNDNTQDMLTVLTDEVNTLRGEIRTAQQDRDEQFAQVVNLTDLLNQARGELARLNERHDQLLAQNATMSRVLEKHGLEAETPVSHIPPRLQGEVTQVSSDDLLEVSLGADDGLRKGHLMEIYRGSQYLGRVEVVSTKPDVSVARILKPYHRGPIQRGDRVRTKVD